MAVIVRTIQVGLTDPADGSTTTWSGQVQMLDLKVTGLPTSPVPPGTVVPLVFTKTDGVTQYKVTTVTVSGGTNTYTGDAVQWTVA